MNHENHLPMDPELEARIVAWVLGEASAFEAAELERHVAADPALAAFKRRIEAVHGLVGEAERPAPAGRRMSPAKRAKLLAAIGESNAAETVATAVVEAGRTVPSAPETGDAANPPRLPRHGWRIPVWAFPMAACLLFGVFVIYETQFRGDLSLERENPFEKAKTAAFSVDEAEVHTSVDARRQRAAAEAHASAQARTKEAKAMLPVLADVPTPADDKVVEMAPFKVDSTRDGYAGAIAASTPPARSNLLPKGTILGGIEKPPLSELDSQLSRNSVRNAGDVAGTITLTSTGGAVALDSTGAALKKDRSFAAPLDQERKQQMTWPGDSLVQSKWAERNELNAANLAGAPVGAARLGTHAESGAIQLSAPASVAPTLQQNIQVPVQTAAGALVNSVAAGASAAPASAPVATSVSSAAVGGWSANNPTSIGGNVRYAEVPSQPAAGGSTGGYAATGGGGSVGDLAIRAPEETIKLDSFEVAAPKKRGLIAKVEDLFRPKPKPPAPSNVPMGPPPGFPTPVPQQIDQPVVHREPPVHETLRTEVPTAAEPFSTFSLHVSDVSFRLAQTALDRGELPDPGAIRPEEFYNAFDYGDPAPLPGEPVACRIEQAQHPFLQQRNLVRIAMKVPATGRSAGQPLHLTVLLDTSGSMERADRVATVRQAFRVLASLLGSADEVTLIGFARQPRLLADRVPGNQAAKLVEIVAHTPAEGGTNLEEALKLAGAQARASFAVNAQNRIVVLTDGAANLGNDDPVHLGAQVEALRQQGIAFDACGIGVEGLDDSVLEALTREGDGRYYVINSPDEADAGFAHQLAGAFRPAAENVKVQVRFNPARVAAYRLIGFEQHRLRTEDFRNDRVDAAELAAEEAAVAVYQVEVKAEGEGELGDVFVRFRNASTGQMVERSWTLTYQPQPPAFDQASSSMQLAGTAALLADKLRGGAPAGQIRLAELAPVVNRLRGNYAHDARVQEFVRMFENARRRLHD